MAIAVWGYLKEYEQEKEEIFAAIEKVFSSGKLILGNSVKNFEHAFSQWCGSQYGVGVGNGTDSLFLALKALQIGPGDEVISVSNTAVPTIAAITAAGARAVFVDIDPHTYLMDVNQIEAAITKNTKCILPVHLFGQCVNMGEINRIADKYNLKVLEDCAQSHGAKYKGKRAGSMSHVSSFSFYPTKILGGFGDGGMLVTNDESLNSSLRRLRFYGMEKQYYSLELGYNSRLDEVHAEILLQKMKHLDNYIARRQELARRYYQALESSDLVLPKIAPDNEHAFYLFVVRHPKRDMIIEELKKRDIFVNISYPWPIHTMPAYEHLGFKAGSLPHTERAACEIFSLPMYPSLSNEEQDVVIDGLHEILNKKF